MDPDNPGVFKPFNWEAEALSPWDPTARARLVELRWCGQRRRRVLPVTIGSDGGGSTRLPAAYSGVVGLHTSRGLIPHVDYVKPTMLLTASYGPLARDVRDVALFTSVMAGPDGRDDVALQTPTPDVLAHLDDGVDGMRMAWTEDFGYAGRYATDQSAAIIDVARATAMGLRDIGAVVEPTDLGVGSAPAAGHRALDGRAGRLRGDGRHQPGAPAARRSVALPGPGGVRARNWEQFRRLFQDVDVILSVTAQRTSDTTQQWDANWTTEGPSFPGGSFAPVYCSHTMIFNWLGFPAVSVPCGFVDGLPVGLQIAGWHGREDVVARVARAFQQAFPRDERPAVS